MDVNKYPTRVYERDQIEKGYRKIVFKPGAPSASSEMNETQQIIQYNLSKLASSIYPDATVIAGGFSEIVNNVISFVPTTTSIDGNIFEIPATTVTITGNGDENVGFLYKEEYITSTDDPDLLNPAVGTANYGSPGADRIKITVEWSLMPTDESTIDENTKFFPVYTFINGVMQTVSEDTDTDQTKMLNLLANYNYSANGSFVTNGMTVIYVEDDEERVNEDGSTGSHTFELTAGEAFVEGFQINNKFNQKFYLNFLNDQKNVLNEPFTFTTDKYYPLRWNPIASVEEINGIMEVTESVVRSAVNQDRINTQHPDNPVTSIVKVSSTADGEGDFTANVDYKVSTTNGDYIDWTNSPHAPATGATYYITYQCQTTVPVQISDNRSEIYVSGLVPGTIVNVDYHFYLKRIDRVVLNRDGSISILAGTPHETNPMPAYNASGLSIALILVSRGIAPEISSDTNRVFKMSDIRRLADKVDTNEYNISVLSLKDDIRTDYPMSNKTNMVVDPFANDNGRDSGKTQNAVTTGSSLMSAFNTNTYMVSSGGPITLDFTEVVAQQNEFASKSRSVNIYSTINPNELGVLKISPSKYSWVANETIRESHGYITNRTGFATGSQGSSSYGQNWRWMQAADYTTYNNTAVSDGVVLPLPSKVVLTVDAALFAANEPCDLFLDVNSSFLSTQVYEYEDQTVNSTTKAISVTSFDITPPNTIGVQVRVKRTDTGGWTGFTTVAATNYTLTAAGTGTGGTVTTTATNWYALASSLTKIAVGNINICQVRVFHYDYKDQQFTATSSQGNAFTVTAYTIADANRMQVYKWVNNTWQLQAASTFSVSGQKVTINTVNVGDKFLIRQLMGDGTHVGSSRTIVDALSSIFGTVTANADGKVEGAEVELPDFITTGSRVITIRGRVTGSMSQTTFVADARSIDATVTFWYDSDPLAQTYMADDTYFISSVEIFVDELPTSYLDVLLAKTIVGYPDHEQAYNQKRKYRNELVAGQWNRFKFDCPSRVEKDTLESFMVATSDSAAKIRCSELGKYDPYQKVWITKQGYAAGTLLESSDAKTWSPIHTEDITFRLYRAEFSGTKSIDLGTINVTNATDLTLSVVSQVFSGTSITYTVTLVGRSETLEVSPGTFYEIQKYTGPVKVSATLRSSNSMVSPILFKDVTLTTMTRVWPSNYITRNFDVTASGQADLKVVLDQYEPSGSEFKVQYLNASGNFVDMVRNPKSTVVVGDIVKVEYGVEDIDLRQTQVQIIMNTNNEMSRPYCQNLRIFVEPKS